MTSSKKGKMATNSAAADAGATTKTTTTTTKTTTAVAAANISFQDDDLKARVVAFIEPHINREYLEQYKIPVAIVLVATVLTGNTKTLIVHVLIPIGWLTLRVIAVALGVALGLGFAAHVYDQLEVWAGNKRKAEQNNGVDIHNNIGRSRKEETQALLMDHLRGSSTSGFGASASAAGASGKQLTKVAPSGGTSSKIDPGASHYVALMASAGYEVDPYRQRGQVVKEPPEIMYPWCDTPLDRQYAIRVMGEEWPTLPSPILRELGRFIEFVMRDYVSTWYSMIDMDEGILYPDCVQEAKDIAFFKDRGEEFRPNPNPKPPPKPHTFPKFMILTTNTCRKLPVIENIYRSISIVLGNLAHRVQDVNAFRLVLLKWTKVIAHTFKVYRELRKAVLEKQTVKKTALVEVARGRSRSVLRRTVNSVTASVTSLNSNAGENATDNNSVEAAGECSEQEDDGAGLPVAAFQPVDEIALTREFLVTGKLHPACTFGLEIPSLLFSDPTGQECGTVVEDDDTPVDKKNEDQVLEERLFKSKLLSGCELDYNRVLASRIVKLLIPRQDFASPIAASLMTELMAGCVLTPVMSVFSPDYLNDWIMQALDETVEEDKNAAAEPQADSVAASGEKAPIAPIPEAPQVMRSWDEASDTKEGDNLSRPRVRTFSDEDGDFVLEDGFDKDERQELGELMDLSSSAFDADKMSALNKEAAAELMGSMEAGSTEVGRDATESDEEVDEDNNDSVELPGNEFDEEAELTEERAILEEDATASYDYIMLRLLDDALVKLQSYIDAEEEQNRDGGSGTVMNWDDQPCKDAVLRLVLIVESMMFHGRRKKPVPISGKKDKAGENIEMEGGGKRSEIEEEFHAGHLIQLLMELTSDIDTFENMHVKEKDDNYIQDDNDYADLDPLNTSTQDYEPTMSDLSTLRTLIAAWLHTGQIHRAVSTFAKAKTTVLRPFYHSHAFLRNPQTSEALVRKLRALDGVDVMVDTVAILNSPRLDPEQEIETIREQRTALDVGTSVDVNSEDIKPTSTPSRHGLKGRLGKGMKTLNDKKKEIGSKVNKGLKESIKGRNLLGKSQSTGEVVPSAQGRASLELTGSSLPSSSTPSTFHQMQHHYSTTPRYLEYHKNESFASSLRSERDRRMQSWVSSIQNDTEIIQIVVRAKGATPEDIAYHRELHHVARIFYAGTNIIGIRDAARSSSADQQRQRLNTGDSVQSMDSLGSGIQSPEVSLLTVEMACARRRIEVPDDDSSFLLRAQPRPLNSIGVHRDTRNADLSYRSFAGSYEEPAVLPGSNKYAGGRYVRRCYLRYYPSNRTASIVVSKDIRKLDQRKGMTASPETGRDRQQNAVAFISPEFLRERHLCQKCIPRGSTSRSQPGMLSSNVMEQADFTAAPRTGRALDFVYRMSLFESPMVDLSGKRFTVHDSVTQSSHRADASVLEMSDAALSAALLVIGRDYGETTESPGDESSVVSNVRNRVELGPDGYPIIWMKYSKKQNDGTTSTEIKPYRTSFVRAALLISSTRQEAQLQCLIKCVKAGSAKSATKARTDAQLRPTLRLLDFARDRSREKQEKLMRDLKLGMNHIDRDQLRRNALVSPRYPTVIRSLQVSVKSAMAIKDAPVRISGNPQGTVFKIQCIATVSLVEEHISEEALQSYLNAEGKLAASYKETWVVFRQLKEFQSLHKHLKTQVAAAESSGTAGSRLVGAAAAAFTQTQTNRSRHRGAMIPSLGQASKTGALGVTQRSAEKRMESLDRYLQHLLTEGNPLRRCTELLMFIGAFYPLAPDVLVDKLPISPLNDPLGRVEMAREVLEMAARKPLSTERASSEENSSFRSFQASTNGAASAAISGSISSDQFQDDPEKEGGRSEKVTMANKAIVDKIDQVALGQVRRRIFELLGYQFGFENASFFRGRMLSALKTMSFAVTTPGEFRKTLYKTHVEQISPEALASWISFGTETLWPDGVFFESKPPLTPEQQRAASDKARKLLHENFPEQLRTVLGGELTSDGIDVLHEMLQHRLVVKSMFYMLFDLLWEEVFPEMKDILSGGDALNIDFDEEY